MKKILLPILALAGWLAVPNANASWAYVPLELRMAGAKYIVVGKIDRIVDGIERNGRTYDVGAISVKQILKGPKGLKEVKLMWPGPAPFALSTDIKFRKGQEGVWILYPDKMTKGVHWASYPSDFQVLKNLPNVQAKLKALNTIAWSKPVNGVQVGAIIEQRDVRKQKIVQNGKPIKALARATAYIVLRNTGKAVTHVVNFSHDRQVTVKLTGPDGKAMPMRQGQFGGKAPKLAKHHFVPLPTGGIHAIGYGHGLPLLVQPGKYTLEIAYENKRAAGKLIKGAAWQGNLSGETVFWAK